MEKIKQLEERLYEEKNQIGLVSGAISIGEFEDLDRGVYAHVTPHDWKVEVKLKKGFTPVSDKRQKAYARIKQIQDPLEKLVVDVTAHEFAHWSLPFGSGKGCPTDIYWHDKILEVVKDTLPQDKKSQAEYVANAFEDMLINPRAREWRGDLSGLVLFWDNEGLLSKSQGQKRFTPFYEAFVMLNMHLFGDKKDVALLKRHYSNDGKIKKAVEKTIRDLSLPAQVEDSSVLFEKQRWVSMAGAFTRNLAELLDQNQGSKERLSAYGNPQQGQGEKSAGNGIGEEAKTSEGKEVIAVGRYGSKERLSTNITDFEQLDGLYRSLARDIAVKVEAISRDSSLSIAPLTLRPFNEEKDDMQKAKLSKLYVTDEGLRFGYPQHPLTINAKQKFQRRDFPNFKMVVLDNSRSMQEPIDGNGVGNAQTIHWGDNSKYHYALLGFYGIESFLQRQGIAQWIEHGVSLFSSSTRLKQGDYSRLDEIRKHALHPDWGGTNIDANTLKEALQGRQSFVLSISDGEVANWDTEKAKFEQLAKENYYTHIQIGGETGFSRDLKSMNVPVFYVASGKDLSTLMVDLTKQTYEHFTKE